MTKEERAAYYQANKHRWVERAETNRERKNQLQREYNARHPEKVKAKSIEWIEKNFEYNLWSQAKRRAAREGIEFSISREDVQIPAICPYLGFPLTRSWGKGPLPTNASIDKINPAKGYVSGNIEVISRMANTMKSNATQEQLETFARNVLKKVGCVS